MKSRTYTSIAFSALAATALSFSACSSDSGTGSQASDGTDQVQSALDPISPFQCRNAIRECVNNSCAAEIKELLASFPFSPRGFRAIADLQKCAVTKCLDACSGTGGATGAGGATSAGGASAGGSTATGGASAGGSTATGGTTATGGASAGGAPEAGGATATGGAPEAGGSTSTGGVSAGGGPEAGGTTSTGGVSAGGAPDTGGATSTGGAPEAGGTTSTGGTPGTGGTTSTGVDLTGTWISRVQTAGTISAPVVGSTAANIDIVLRLSVTQTATSFDGTVQICRLNTVTTPNASSLVVTFTPAVLATLKTTASEPAFTATVGQPVPLPAITIFTGQDASGTSVDSDMDGHPGVTIPANVGGLIMLNAYTGLTIKTNLTSTLSDPNTISGTASFSSTGTVFGSDNAILTSGNINVTPSSTAIPFSATKLAGDVPCDQVLTHF